MALKVCLRVVLAMASEFVVGNVWWCEACGGGGFVHRGTPTGDHRKGCKRW